MGRSENEGMLGNLQNNVEVRCSSLQESCRFYSLALGFPIICRDSEMCVLDGGGHRLTLRAQGPADTTVRGNAQTGVSIEVERIFETFEKLVSDGLNSRADPVVSHGEASWSMRTIPTEIGSCSFSVVRPLVTGGRHRLRATLWRPDTCQAPSI